MNEATNIARTVLENNITPNYESNRGNNTIGFLSYRKPNLLNFNDPNNKNENLTGIPNINQLPYQMNNINNNNKNLQEEEDDGRFHELSMSKNFNRFNMTSPFGKPLGFEQAMKQQQQQNNPQNNLQNSQIGRRTFVKKLPSNEDNNTDIMNNMNNNPPLNKKISGNILNNQMNTPYMNNMIKIGENNEPRNNSFGTNINVKRMPPEPINNINLSQANNPINNKIPNAAAFNPNIQNLNQINNNLNQNPILPSRNINVNILPNEQMQKQQIRPYITPQGQINYTINNQIIPQSQILERSASPDDLMQILPQHIGPDQTPKENQISNIEQNEQNDSEQNEEIGEENNIDDNNNNENDIEQNNEDNEENEEQNKENEEDNNNYQKDPNISYNEFDSTGWLKLYGGLSRQGRDINGQIKINQDSLVSQTNINNIKDFNIFGVLDGHGPEGHHVSKFASEFIPNQITENPEIKSLKDPELIYHKLKENNCQIITEAFLLCDEQLKNVDFDAYSSGTTCILIIHIGQHILCANVGDSRAIVTYDDQEEDPELNYLEEAQLSIDYKPNLEEEKNRILLSGGIVGQMENQFGQGVGPFRVWEKDKDYPGLAMSRSIGDLKGKSIGIISEPGILEYDLNEATKYIVIASDGVWEFLKNDEVRELGKSYYLENNSSAFCHKIVDTSVSIWEKRESIIDDITIVVMFF